MKKIFLRLIVIGWFVLLPGCQEAPAEEVAEATAVPAEAATATTAAEPTSTAEPTETATIPPTATNSPTPEPSETPTETATNTSVPLTATNTATAVLPTEAPATATTAPPAPVSAPPPAPAPAGPNLLSNPGFELDGASWEIFKPGQPSVYFNIYTTADNPQFVHSGQKALTDLITNRAIYSQRIENNVSPGTTYRAGAWVKIWSSSGEDRTISENPGEVGAQVCINVAGEGDPSLDTSFCSAIVRPLDVWQFISVDGVASTDRLTIMLVSFYTGQNRPLHNEAIWDDATLGTAPSSATATPPPAAGPIRPNPIAFSPTALRDSMTSVRWTIEQAGGLLDRLYNGENQTCTEYQGYYDDAIRSATYSGVADDWAGLYNDYIFAVENFLATNESINALCDGGGGGLSQLNYGAARQGINNSLDRLIPAIEAANAKLGG
jgi:hypothetical protein